MPDLPNILQRTAAQWAAINPFLPKGMLAVESDSGRKKVGTGLRYSATPYVPDETTAELPTSAAEGDVLTYASGAWQAAAAPSGTPTVIALTYAATLNTDASAGDIFDVTLTGNATLANPTNPVDGKTLRWRIRQDGTGSRTVTLGDKFVIPSSATSPLPFSTAANAMDILAATYHAGRDKWDVVAFVMGY